MPSGYLRESLKSPKGSQATCCPWCGRWDGYGANAGETGFISIWFGVHRAILLPWGDIKVLLVFWQCSWGLSVWSSIKHIKAPYVFDWEHVIALNAMHRNRASSRGAGEFSWVFSSWERNLGYILELRRGWPFETWVYSGKSGLLSSYDGHLRNLN